MHDPDAVSDLDTGERTSTTTRRTFLSVATLGGATASFTGVLDWTGDSQAQVIELGGETAGWVGRQPSDIEGQTNPTLSLTAGQPYEVTWENVDGVPHNFAVMDGDGNPLAESEIIDGQGATQTVEFTASEEMAEYLCQVHPNTMRGDVSLTAETPTGTPTETPTETPEETPGETPTESPEETPDEPARVTISQEIVEDERGDVPTFTFSIGESDQIPIRLGSTDVNYEVTFTAADLDGDGEVTVALDTFVAGRGNRPGVGAVGDDVIRAYEQRTPTLSSPLEAAVYPIRVIVDDRVEASGALVLQSRETSAAYSGVVHRNGTPSEPAEFPEQVSRRDDVATGDLAFVEVEASGLYATLDGIEAFTDDSLGYELTIEEAEALNVEPYQVPLEEISIVTDPDNDRFFAVVDSASLEVGTTYEGTFAITDANPYVPEGERESVSTRFSIVERTATFDVDGDVLEVPPDETTLSGTTTVAPGTTLDVSVSGTEANPFQMAARPTVEEDGSWSASFDFSDIDLDTAFVARVLELSEPVEGRVTSAE